MATQATTAAAPAPAQDQPKTEEVLQERSASAESIVRKNIYWALGAGAIPVPIADLLAITAVQIKMLRQLSSLYEVPFMEHKVKNLVGSLIAGLASVGTGTALTFSALKIIPIIGTAAGYVAMPIAAGGITYATGRVFTQHFETGGTFLDFDPEKVREYFRKEFEQGKSVATKIKSESKPS